MASQIVHLSTAILAQLRDARGVGYAFGIQDTSLVMDCTRSGGMFGWVQLDPFVYCPELRSHYSNDIYAVLLASPGALAELAPPPLLPEPVVLKALDIAEEALRSLPDWSAHEEMEILAAFDAARQAQPVLRVPGRIAPRNPQEKALLSLASGLQKKFARELAQLDQELASYHAGLSASGMEAAVLRLGLQAELGHHLRLKSLPTSKLPFPVAVGEPRFCGLPGLLQATHNNLEALQDVAGHVYYARVMGWNWLEVPVLHNLHRVLLKNLPDNADAGRLRSGELRVLSQHQGRNVTRTVPAPGLAAAYDALVRALDAELWHGVHPLLRAALGLHAILQLRPYEDANEEVAGLLAQGMMMEAGIPALPLDAFLYWDRVGLTRHAEDDGRFDSEASFVAYFLRTVGRAIPFGRRILLMMEPTCADIRAALIANGATEELAVRMAEFSGSIVLGPDPQAARRTLHAMELSFYVGRCGCFDEVDATGLGFKLGGYPSETIWSSAMARALMREPPNLRE